MIGREAQRSIRIVQNLLAFARPSGEQMVSVSLNMAVKAATDLRKYELTVNNIDLEVDLHPDLPLIAANPHQMQQLILNLVINAEQAMAGTQNGAKLRVRMEHSDNVVRLVVSDNGPGISADIRSKIFDPFFTTKGVGQGTGLGLSICYGIVKEHGGSIHVESELGRGAAFIVELPVAMEQGSLTRDLQETHLGGLT